MGGMTQKSYQIGGYFNHERKDGDVRIELVLRTNYDPEMVVFSESVDCQITVMLLQKFFP